MLHLAVVLIAIVCNGQDPVPAKVQGAESLGQTTFSSSCASCHGLDGRGSERAPDIATRKDVQALTDTALIRIVDEGIAGKGMPSFRTLGKLRIEATVRYLRGLQGKMNGVRLPGNPSSGRQLFFGKAECSRCHVMEGTGGFIASDLSTYAGSRSGDEVRTAIVKPGVGIRTNQLITVTKSDGQKLSGITRNEDNFSIQLQTLDGTFYSLAKDGLKGVERSSEPLMPTDYGSKLSRAELDDLTSYLMSAAQAAKSQRPSQSQKPLRK